MSKESDDKLPWGLKQSAPGSMKNLTRDKIEAFEHGAMNLPKKQLSKKELEELRRKQEEEEAAALIKDFEASFAESNKSVKAFVKGSIINPGTKDEKFFEKGSLYKPTSKQFNEKLMNKQSPQSKPAAEVRKTVTNSQEKKKTNLELFKEELKRIQEEREARHTNKQCRSDGDGSYVKPRYHNDESHEPSSTSSSSFTSNKQQFVDDHVTTNIFLSNLNSNTNEKELMEIFGRHGPLASVKIMWPRCEEDKIRGANCGFVAFMLRKDAEHALKELDGRPIDGVSLRLSWSKGINIPAQPIYIPPHLLEVTVPPPPSGLPFNAQPQSSDTDYANRNLSDEQLKRVLENAKVKVTIPTDRQLLCLIHRMIEFVVREGPEFEALIMVKEINNPQYRFLFDNQSQAHIYYRWKLFSILQGDSVSDWYDSPFEMFKDGSFWVPPALNTYTKGELDESYEKARHEFEVKKGRLSNEHRDKFEDILRNLTCDRQAIGNAMVFCIDHSDSADEIVDCIIESLSIEHTPIPKKIARLFLVSDILHNCHVKVANVSFYRKGFEKHLVDIFKHLNSIYESFDGKMKKETFKKKVVNCIKAWQELAIYPMDYLFHLQNIFLGFVKTVENTTNNANSNDSSDKFAANQNTNSNSNSNIVPTTVYDEDIDGKPLEEEGSKASANADDDDDIDGKPLTDEDIDGKPLSDEECKKKDKQASSKFIASKWETVDPEQLEKQAVTTSKWDFFDEYQSDKNSNDDSQEERSENDQSNDSQKKSTDQQNESLFQRCSQGKEQLSEEKRQILREVELQAVKYQDELESGRVERSSSYSSVQQQVEHYRNHLLKKRFDNISPQESSRTRSQQRRSRSRSRTRSRSRSRSPRQKYSSTGHKKTRQRSRSTSPRRYNNKKKVKY